MKDYIKRTYNTDRKEYYLFNQIPVFILNELPSNISVEQIINILEEYIPSFLFKGLDGVYIGDFQELNDRNVQALFKDDAIYLSSFRDGNEISEELLAREVTHELAHSLEQRLSNEIYSDGKIENEYTAKKEKLYSRLKHENIKFPKEFLFDDDLVDELDDLLYKKIGYDKISLVIPGLFLSPYCITSIREYFANGLEEYYLGDPEIIKSLSPALYKKLEEISYKIDFS